MPQNLNQQEFYQPYQISDAKSISPIRIQSSHGFLFRGAKGGGALGSSGVLKPRTHPVIAIFLYHLGAVEVTYQEHQQDQHHQDHALLALPSPYHAMPALPVLP
ncbi:hypothetical protein Tco_0002413 [Tanacetum coccineum]